MYNIDSFKKFVFQICLVALMFYLFDFLLDKLSLEIKALLNLISFSTSFFISLIIYYRHRNMFLPAVLGIYSFATIIEMQSKIYAYTDISYGLWNIGNILILCGFSYELIKLCRK